MARGCKPKGVKAWRYRFKLTKTGEVKQVTAADILDILNAAAKKNGPTVALLHRIRD